VANDVVDNLYPTHMLRLPVRETAPRHRSVRWRHDLRECEVVARSAAQELALEVWMNGDRLIVRAVRGWRSLARVCTGALLCLTAGVLAVAPAAAQSAACSPQTLPAGATIVASDPDVIVYGVGEFGLQYYACLQPSGSPIALSIAGPEQAQFVIAGEWVGYFVYASGDPVVTFMTLNARTGKGASYPVALGATINASGDVLGIQQAVALPGRVLRHDLVLYTPASGVPVELDPAARERATFSGGKVAITRGALHLTVDPAVGTVPHTRVSACLALSRHRVLDAGGTGSGANSVVLDGSGRRVCAWGALELVDHPENRSERSAILASAHADHLRFLRIAGEVSFVYAEPGPPTLMRVFVSSHTGLIEVALATSRPRRVLAGLEAAAAVAVRALGR
jgi:hypothetical protein